MWYDSFLTKNSTLHTKFLKKQRNKSQAQNCLNSLSRQKTTNYVVNYIIPLGWKCIVICNTRLKLHYIYLYSNIYYFTIPIFFSKNTLNFDSNTNQLWFKPYYINNFVLTYLQIVSSFYQILTKPIFSKIKFKGKGYYVYKNYRNTVTPQFGYSHRLYLYAYYINVVFITKTSLILFGCNLKDIKYISNKFVKWRNINIFTGRGVRFSKQIIYKKSGKVSTYR